MFVVVPFWDKYCGCTYKLACELNFKPNVCNLVDHIHFLHQVRLYSVIIVYWLLSNSEETFRCGRSTFGSKLALFQSVSRLFFDVWNLVLPGNNILIVTVSSMVYYGIKWEDYHIKAPMQRCDNNTSAKSKLSPSKILKNIKVNQRKHNWTTTKEIYQMHKHNANNIKKTTKHPLLTTHHEMKLLLICLRTFNRFSIITHIWMKVK